MQNSILSYTHRPAITRTGAFPFITTVNDGIQYVKQVDNNVKLFDAELRTKIGTRATVPGQIQKDASFILLWQQWLNDWRQYVQDNTCGDAPVCVLNRTGDAIVEGAKNYESQLAQFKLQFKTLGYDIVTPDVAHSNTDIVSQIPWSTILLVAGIGVTAYLIKQVRGK